MVGSSSPLDALDIARAYMRAWNRRDRAALDAAYHPDAVAELFAPVASEDGERWSGRAAIVAGLDAFFAAYDGALAGGQFFEVRTVARIETGWTHVEWTARLSQRPAAATDTAEETAYAGYFHFRIRDGLIAEQRAVAHATELSGAPLSHPEALQAQAARADGGSGEGPPRGSRLYPSRPIVGVGAVIIADGQVVLIKRKFEPLAGQWSLPGGSLEVGETLEAGVAREMLEETGLEVEVGPVVDVFDRILLDAERRVRYHFVLIDYLCTPRGGELRAASDVADARLVDPDQLAEYRLTPKAEDVIRKGVARWKALLLAAAPEEIHGHPE
jgi:ADP-ribose pyrophosphatase YjhB (NUDIX family)/ketosteroid isomerase-like protein